MSFQIISIQFSHETNTFSDTVTDRDAFKRRVFVEGPEVKARYAGTSTELGAHWESAQRYGWVLKQPFAAHATPAGPVSASMFEYAVERLLDAADGADGAILALHGAMVAQGHDDAEGYLIQRLRQAMGPDRPIVVTVDTHANVTQRMADHANAIIAYRTYPHVDQFEVATEAAALLDRMLQGGALTRAYLFRLPLLDGCDHGRTHGAGPMPALLAQASAIRDAQPALDVISITAGFPWSDIEEAGPAITVTSRLDADAVRLCIAPLLDLMWKTRHERSIELLPLPELISEIQSFTVADKKPVVVADFSDNPGHGAPGDGVALIRALHDAGIGNVAVACICDPEAVQKCHQAGQGAEFRLQFGARQYPRLYGAPMDVMCTVLRVGEGDMTCMGPMRKGMRLSLGPTATIRFDGLTVVLASNNLQVQDLNFFYSNGIDPLAMDVLVVKSQQHFRAAFEPIAASVLLADSGGFVSPDLSRLPYKNIRRPVWPLDDISGQPSSTYTPRHR